MAWVTRPPRRSMLSVKLEPRIEEDDVGAGETLLDPGGLGGQFGPPGLDCAAEIGPANGELRRDRLRVGVAGEKDRGAKERALRARAVAKPPDRVGRRRIMPRAGPVAGVHPQVAGHVVGADPPRRMRLDQAERLRRLELLQLEEGGAGADLAEEFAGFALVEARPGAGRAGPPARSGGPSRPGDSPRASANTSSGPGVAVEKMAEPNSRTIGPIAAAASRQVRARIPGRGHHHRRGRSASSSCPASEGICQSSSDTRGPRAA